MHRTIKDTFWTSSDMSQPSNLTEQNFMMPCTTSSMGSCKDLSRQCPVHQWERPSTRRSTCRHCSWSWQPDLPPTSEQLKTCEWRAIPFSSGSGLLSFKNGSLAKGNSKILQSWGSTSQFWTCFHPCLFEMERSSCHPLKKSKRPLQRRANSTTWTSNTVQTGSKRASALQWGGGWCQRSLQPTSSCRAMPIVKVLVPESRGCS